jgi:hypothetical protein
MSDGNGGAWKASACSRIMTRCADLDGTPEVPGPAGTRRVVARGPAGAKGSAWPHERLPAPPAAHPLPTATRPHRRRCGVFEGRERGVTPPRLSLRCPKDRTPPRTATDRGDPGPAALRMGPSTTQAQGTKPASLRSDRADRDARPASAVPYRRRRDTGLGKGVRCTGMPGCRRVKDAQFISGGLHDSLR